MTPDQISDDPAIQARYEELLAKGNTPRFAEMLACQQAPGSITGDDFLRGRRNGYGLDDPHAIARLKKAGVPENGVYCPGLARFRYDPRAVVSSYDEARSRCREMGAGSEELGVKRREVEPEMVEFAPDVLRREVAIAGAVDPAKVSNKKRLQRTVDEVKTRLKGDHA